MKKYLGTGNWTFLRAYSSLGVICISASLNGETLFITQRSNTDSRGLCLSNVANPESKGYSRLRLTKFKYELQKDQTGHKEQIPTITKPNVLQKKTVKSRPNNIKFLTFSIQ